MPEFGDEDGERLYVDRQGHSTTIETDFGTVTLELDDPKGNEFELTDGSAFCEKRRSEQEKILWEQAACGLIEYWRHYREKYGGGE